MAGWHEFVSDLSNGVIFIYFKYPITQGHAIIRCWISQKQYKIDTRLLQMTTTKWYSPSGLLNCAVANDQVLPAYFQVYDRNSRRSKEGLFEGGRSPINGCNDIN